MSPLAAPERPSVTRTAFDDMLAEHPELADLQQLDRTIAEDHIGPGGETASEQGQLPAEVPVQQQPEEAVDVGHEAVQQSAQLRTNLNSSSSPAAPSPATPPSSTPPVSTTPMVPSLPDNLQHEPGNDEPLSIVVIDQSVDAKKMARALAEQRLSEEAHEGGRLKKLARAMWKNGVAHEWYRQKYIRQAHQQIIEHQDVLHDTESTKSARKQAEDFLFKRFVMGDAYISEQVGGEQGEQRSVLNDNSQLGKDLKQLIIDAAHDPTMSADAITEKYNKLINDYRNGDGKELFGSGEVTSHNIHGVIEQMRGIGLHGESLIHAVSQMRVISGESRSASRTEAHYSAADKLIERLGEKGRLASVSPELIATGVALGLGVLKVARGTLLKATGISMIPGATGAIFGALRGRKIAQDEIAQHESDAEFGRLFDENDKRRKRLEERAMRDRKTALELINSLQTTSATERLDEGGDEALKAALKALAEVQVRQGLYDMGQVVLQWSDETKRDEESFHLTRARLQSAALIQKRLESLTAEDRARLNFADDATINDVLAGDEYEPEVVSRLNVNIEATDKERKKYVRDRMIGHAALGFGASFGISMGVNFAADLLSSSGGPGGLSQSALHDQGNGVKINSDYSMEPDRAGLQMGNYDLKGPDGKVVLDNLQRDPVTGKFDDASLRRLHDAGFEMKVSIQAAETTTQQVSVDDYINKHPGEFQKLNIQWMDNNTTQFDLNEQGGRFMANPDGTVTIGQNMTADGSFHGNMGIDMTDPARGQNVIDMAFKQPDGTFLHKTFNYGESIPKPWADMLYQKQDGTWGFKGNGHVSWGKADGETFYSAASISGDGGHPMLTDTIEKTPAHTTYEITAPAENNGNYIGGVVYTLGRNRLTAAERPAPYYNYYNPEHNKKLEKSWRLERSPRLKSNPDADLNTGEELNWYRDRERKRRGKEYVNEIDGYIDQSAELQALDANVKAMVNIPVAGASESENIYKTLSFFANQNDPEAIKSTMVVLNVNWKRELESDPDRVAKIQKTLSEIERARKDFPDLKIASFTKVWERDFVQKRQGKIYGEVIKYLYDTSAFAVQKAIKEGRMSPDNEVLLITNDADTDGMSRSYLHNYIKTFESNPKQDAFTGLIRRGTEAYKDYPGYGVVSSFYAMMTMTMLRQQSLGTGGFSTDGPNSGMRMSMYAGMGGVEENIGAGADGMLTHKMSLVRRSPGERSLVGRIRGRKLPQGSNRVMGRFVAGAAIDTVPDRLLGAYKQGKWIAEGWTGFDNGGYEDRSQVLAAATLRPENPETEIDAIAKRVETSIEGFGTNWWRNPAAMSSALMVLFGYKNTSGDPLYEYHWKKDAQGNISAFSFKFTDSGKQALKVMLIKKRNGGSESYGQRLQRQLYSSRSPIRPESQMLS